MELCINKDLLLQYRCTWWQPCAVTSLFTLAVVAGAWGRGGEAGRNSTTVVRDTSDGSRFFAAFGPPFDAQRFFRRGPLPGKARRLRKQLYARGNPAELF